MPDFNGNRQFAWYVSPCKQHPEGKFHRGGKPVGSWAEMLAARDHHWMHACYHSTYAFADWTGGRLNAETAKSAIINRIYIDTDDKANPQRAVDDAAEVAWYIGPHTTQWFSGMKGIGMLIHCHPVDLIPDLKGAVLSRFVNNLIDGVCEVETIDFAVVGDLNRVHRMTNSRHQTTGLYAIPLHQRELCELSIDEICAMAADKRKLVDPVIPSQWVTDELYRIEGVILHDRMNRLVDSNTISESLASEFIGDIYEGDHREDVYRSVCLIEDEWRRIRAKNAPKTDGIVGRSPQETWLLKVVEIFKAAQRMNNIRPAGSKVSTSPSEHEARCHIAHLMEDCGWDRERMHRVFSYADDYDGTMTDRQLNSLIGRR